MAVVVLIATLAWRSLDLSPEDIEDAVRRAGVFGPVIYSGLLLAGLSVPFNPMSDLLVVSVAALVFEPEVAVAATFAAHTVSLSLNYLVARRYGEGVLRILDSPRAARLVERLGSHLSYRAIFGIRFALPLTGIGIDVVSYLAGRQRLSFPPFFLVSIVPWTLISVVYFYSAAALRERSALLVLAPAAVLLLVPSLVLWVRRRALARSARSVAR